MVRRAVQIIGFLTAAEGLLFATIPRGYARALRTDRLGRAYIRFTDTLNSLPDSTLRLMGAAEILSGTAAALLIGRFGRPEQTEHETERRQAKEQTKERKGKIEIKEMVSGQKAVQFLRELADSIEQSREFQAHIREKTVSIPPQSAIEVEYESKEGGGELELELKWKSA